MTDRGGPDDATTLKVVQALERQNEALDAEVSMRLADVRRDAVAQLRDPAPASMVLAFGNWIPLGAMATTLLAVGLLVAQAQLDVLPRFDSETQALVASELELLEELEFVAWMLDEEELGAT